jgi:hypothetical protein
VSIARSPDGHAHGYGFSVPVSQSLLAILPPGGAIATTVERGLPEAMRRDLPPTWQGAQVTYMSAVAVRGERAAEALGALAADFFRLAVRGGVFLACTGDETSANVSAALGMTRIAGVGLTSALGSPQPLDGYVLDMDRIGPDNWLDAVTNGRPLPPNLPPEELERELHRVLVSWPDDAQLAASPLVQLAEFLAPGPDTASATDNLRTMVREALAEASATDREEIALACRALELAYFERKVAHEAIAERLNVSRSSFYRLLHRGEREIASRLGSATRA